MIYFFRPVGQCGPIKIGCSKMPRVRMAAFQSWSPVPLEMMGVVEGNFVHERYIHRRFAADRLHAEWFAASDELVAFVDDALKKKRIDVPSEKKKAARFNADPDRDGAIRKMRAEGWSLQKIGDEYGLTRERVRQIINKKVPAPVAHMQKEGQ